jgi:PAS domain S-box-containing protein
MKLSTRLALAMIALVLFTATAVWLLTYRDLEIAILPRTLERLQAHAKLQAVELESYVRGARADVLGFRAAVAVEGIIRARRAGGMDPIDGMAESTWRMRMASRFLAELESKPHYQQFRIIGVEDGGREIVRVERSTADGRIRIVADDGLQRKGDRDYFQKAIGISPGKVYFSAIDLNQEGGAIEIPHLPVMRVATVIQTADGQPFGIIIINIDMGPALDRIRRTVELERQTYLVNEQGDFLVHSDRKLEFGFDLGRRYRVEDDLPELAPALASDRPEALTIANAAGRRLVVAVTPVHFAAESRGAIIESTSYEQAMRPVHMAQYSTLLAAGFATSLAMVLAVLLARSFSRPLAQMTAAVQTFGNRKSMDVPVSAAGEIGVLARAFRHMADEISSRSTLIENYVERERFYIAAVESSHQVFLTTHPDGTITAWNPGAELLFGYSAEEAIGRHVSLIVPEDRRAEGHADGEKLRRLDRVVNFETVRIDKNGKLIDVALDLSPIISGTGEFLGGVYLARDITAQKLAQEMFRLAVEACPSGMLMIDRTGTIVMINSEIERLFGYERHELINKPVDILVPDHLRQQHAGHRNAFVHNPETRRMGVNRDLFGRRKDGTEFPVEVGLNPIPIRDGLLVLSVIVDISERKRVERLKAEFVSTVSHELRTPLTSIAGSLGLLTGGAAGELAGPTMRLLTIAHKNSERLVRLINDILDVEKIESGKLVFNLKRLNAYSLMEQAIEAARGFADSYGVRVRLETSADSALVRADPDRLVQIFTNLLSNAIKFSPRDDEVVVALEMRADMIRIAVSDHGGGIAEEFKSRIFEKFAQADATDARQKGGTGLGLSIVKQLVTLLGGVVGFETPPSGGTTFHVDLPRWDPMASADPALSGGARQPCVLICDDDMDVAHAISERLRSAGFASDIAGTAQDALAEARRAPYDAILVDLKLPDSDGISLVQDLRAERQYQNTPIIVVSADAARGRHDIRSSSINVLDWLNKPFDINQLVDVLNRPLARNGNKRPHVLHIDDDPAVLAIVAEAIGQSCAVTSVTSIVQARDELAAHRFDLAVLDLMLSQASGLDLLPDLRRGDGSAIPVILYSARSANQANAVQVRAALNKSQASIDHLILALREHLADYPRLAPNKTEVA